MAKIILKDYQQQAIQHFAKQNYIGIAWHKPGVGKTMMALSAVMSCAPSPRMTYIICPANAKETWENEIEKVENVEKDVNESFQHFLDREEIVNVRNSSRKKIVRQGESILMDEIIFEDK